MQDKLIVLRNNKNITIKSMAELLGITPAQYRKKEKGKVQFKADEMYEISNFFGMKLEDIFLPR